jgi:hypothetical protein
VIAILSDNALTNTVLMSNINKWLKETNNVWCLPHVIYPAYCVAHMIHRVVMFLLNYVDTETIENLKHSKVKAQILK